MNQIPFKKILGRSLVGILGLFLLYIIVLFVYGWNTDWDPAERIALSPDQQAKESTISDSTLSLISWNVGFGGLGQESDFFYDDEGMWYSGSSMTRAPKKFVEKNIGGALRFLQNTKADFFLLQEVDVWSDRSYQIPQYESYCQSLPGYAATMAVNYRCERVPIPLLEPWNAYGQVESGLGTFSRFQPKEVVRCQLPGKYPMPDRMFQLDRCVALHRYATKNKNELVVLNVHNSAYDSGDKIKAIQLPYLKDLAVSEYEKGNYVILGGDWNQCPPYLSFDVFMPGKTQGYSESNIPADFFPVDWQFAYDPTTPTNRKCRDPYLKGQTFETLIDFFIVSPNVQIKTIKGIAQGFEYSDHQPVWLEVILK